MESTARFRPRGLLAAIGGLGLVSLLLAALLFRERFTNWWQGHSSGQPISSAALEDYVPEDSEAVFFVNLRSLREAPVGRQQLEPALEQLLREGPNRLHWIDLLGINPIDDLDTVLISFAPSAGKEPLWLAHGRFHRERFQLGTNKLQAKSVERVAAWECVDRTTKHTTLLVPLGDWLVVSDTPERVRAALHRASVPGPVVVRDAVLRELLVEVDRKQTLWLAASMRRLSSLGGIDSFWLRTLIRPLQTHADGVQGGITCANDLSIDLRFRSVNEDEAGSLETGLTSIRDLIREGSGLLVSQKELLPLLRLLGNSTIQREGRTLSLHGKMKAE